MTRIGPISADRSETGKSEAPRHRASSFCPIRAHPFNPFPPRPIPESTRVLTLILILVLLWFGLTAFLAAWTLWFQAYIYSEAVDRIYWRAPIAGTVLALFFALWVWLDYGTDSRFRTLFEFTTRQERDYDKLLVETDSGITETYLRGKTERGGVVYFKDGNRAAGQLKGRPLKVTVTDEGRQLVFEPERDANGHFLVRPNKSLRYVNKDTGREMEEGYLGQVSTFRWWWLFQNLFINLLHFVFWWACLWLVLKFQFWHAFGIAAVAWLAMTLFVLPPLLNLAEQSAKDRSPSPAAAMIRAFEPRA